MVISINFGPGSVLHELGCTFLHHRRMRLEVNIGAPRVTNSYSEIWPNKEVTSHQSRVSRYPSITTVALQAHRGRVSNYSVATVPSVRGMTTRGAFVVGTTATFYPPCNLSFLKTNGHCADGGCHEQGGRIKQIRTSGVT